MDPNREELEKRLADGRKLFSDMPAIFRPHPLAPEYLTWCRAIEAAHLLSEGNVRL